MSDDTRNYITSFDQFIGNDRAKQLIIAAINDAKERNAPIGNIFIEGMSGCGKSTFAELIANEMNAPFERFVCSSRNIGKISGLFLKIQTGSILFLDEIHNLKTEQFESFYLYFDDGIIQFNYPGRKPVQCKANKVTIIAATTDIKKIPRPFVNRFDIHIRMKHYSLEELSTIARNTAYDLYKMEIDNSGCMLVAKSAKGVAREIQNRIKRIKIHVKDKKLVSYADVVNALAVAGINEEGLDEIDIEYMMTIFKVFNNEATGVSSIANQMQVEEAVLTEIYEPHLLREGYIEKSSRGRFLIDKGLAIAKQIYDNSMTNQL